jgi:hypothetical protein
MNRGVLGVALLAALIGMAVANQGVDVSQAVSASAFHCLKNEGIGHIAVPRVATSIGRIDPNGAATVKHAHEAGVAVVDGYIFPCPHCGDPEGQVKRAVAHLHSEGAKIGRLWLDIEGTQYWGHQSSNRAFFEGLVKGGQAAGVSLGVYTSASQWSPIMGSYTGGSHLPLWYAHYDGRANFGDFVQFGGWHQPHMKQFVGNAMKCGVGVDINYLP